MPGNRTAHRPAHFGGHDDREWRWNCRSNCGSPYRQQSEEIAKIIPGQRRLWSHALDAPKIGFFAMLPSNDRKQSSITGNKTQHPRNTVPEMGFLRGFYRRGVSAFDIGLETPQIKVALRSHLPVPEIDGAGVGDMSDPSLTAWNVVRDHVAAREEATQNVHPVRDSVICRTLTVGQPNKIAARFSRVWVRTHCNRPLRRPLAASAGL